jgi:tetratricopeptide (TPR) repeat protein
MLKSVRMLAEAKPPPSPVPVPAPQPAAPVVVPAHQPVAPLYSEVKCHTAADCVARGRQLTNEGKYTEALAFFDRAIQLNPDLPIAFNSRGFAYLKLRLYLHAIEDFELAIQLNPHYTNALWNRSVALQLYSRAPKASSDH